MEGLDLEYGATQVFIPSRVEKQEASESKDGKVGLRTSQVSDKDHKLQNSWEFWYYKRPVKGGD